ncbi:hypothetical protein TNCV_96201 [Trichonephila clavipes]|nr:hypothetical protein TNCV_96201 [Trichonephila clavipes]
MSYGEMLKGAHKMKEVTVVFLHHSSNNKLIVRRMNNFLNNTKLNVILPILYSCPFKQEYYGYFTSLHAEIVEVEIEVVSPSIVPSGNFAELNRTVTCRVLKANDRCTSCPCHDEFRGPRSDYVRQVASESNNN